MITLVPIQKLHPTQDSFGSLSISHKVKHIENAWSKGKFKKYLNDKIAPGILGPGKKIYILDRHHTAIAILKSEIPKEQKNLLIKILHDWSSFNTEQFEDKMLSHDYLWISPNSNFKSLPRNVDDLIDNPYRSLAWKVRKMGGFYKVEKPFQEFYWSDFFRTNGIILNSSNEADILRVLPDAMKLAASNKAKNTPGFKALKTT